jgi:hypothetical protein
MGNAAFIPEKIIFILEADCWDKSLVSLADVETQYLASR